MRKYGEDDPKFSWHLASAFARTEAYDKAREEYENAFLHYRDDADFLYEYSMFLLEEGRRKEALPLLKNWQSSTRQTRKSRRRFSESKMKIPLNKQDMIGLCGIYKVIHKMR